MHGDDASVGAPGSERPLGVPLAIPRSGLGGPGTTHDTGQRFLLGGRAGSPGMRPREVARLKVPPCERLELGRTDARRHPRRRLAPDLGSAKGARGGLALADGLGERRGRLVDLLFSLLRERSEGVLRHRGKRTRAGAKTVGPALGPGRLDTLRERCKMERMLRARVCDPLGPRWVRTIAPALATTMFVLPPFAPGSSGLRATISLLGAALFFGRRLIMPRFRAREASVAIHPGSIEITGAGILDQFVHASDIVAASSARTAAGVALALVRRGSTERPLLIDFASDDDLDAVRRGLGLGHFAFGEVSWPTQSRSNTLQGSTVLALAWLGMAAASAFDFTGLGLAFALVVVPATLIALLVGCLQDPRGPRISLSAAGARLSETPPWIPPVGYADVIAASANADGVLLTTSGGLTAVPMARSLPEERDHLAAQMLSAAARARGQGPPPPALPAPVARLAPSGETARAWLQRVDGAAASVASAAAYRGSELDPKDLWTALESPDAPTRVRAAAARVLARVAPDEAKRRVADVLACDRDAHACAVIRVALEDDVDVAARELEELGEPSRDG